MSTSEVNGNLFEHPEANSMEDISEYTDADESISAPTEILAEFLSSIMMKDYENALKYCRLILNFEPNNATAQEFYPLIKEKLDNIKRYGDTDDTDGSSDSPDSYSSSADNSSSDSTESNKFIDTDGTTASYSSLEDDDDEKNHNSRIQFFMASADIKNGNTTSTSNNAGTGTMRNTSKEVERLGRNQSPIDDKNSNSSCSNLFTHSTPTTMVSQCRILLDQTRIYTDIKNENPIKTSNLSLKTKGLSNSPKKTVH